MRSIVFAAGLVLGAGLGFYLADRRLQVQYDKRLEKETADMRVFYTTVGKTKYPTPEDAVKALIPEKPKDSYQIERGEDGRVAYHKVIKDAAYVTVEEDPVEQEIVRENIFGTPAQVEHRADVHYITSDEFDAGEMDYTQVNVCWYQGDDIVCDLQDDAFKPDDLDGHFGEGFREEFAKIAKDNPHKTVFIRNTRLSIDFEMVTSDGSYAEEILGLDPPMRNHKDRMRQEP